MKKITIAFYPTFRNPYQILLQEKLEGIGCRFGRIEPRKNYLFLKDVVSIRPDIFHIHWLHPLYLAKNAWYAAIKACLFFLQILALKALKIPIVWTAHNLKDHENRFPRADRFCTSLIVRFADGIIAHCNAAKQELIGQFSLRDPGKIFVIPHGNYIGHYEDTLNKNEARNRLNIPRDVFTVLFLGMLRPYKGVLELIDSFGRSGLDDARLVIAGQALDDAFGRRVGAAASEHKNIIFSQGFVPDEKVQEYLAACDVVVYPYRSILTSGAVILGMSFGRPCIAPLLGCIGEVLDEQGAFLYEPQKDGLTTALRMAFRDKDRLLEMGRHNQERARLWDWQSVAGLTRSVYDSCRQKIR